MTASLPCINRQPEWLLTPKGEYVLAWGKAQLVLHRSGRIMLRNQAGQICLQANGDIQQQGQDIHLQAQQHIHLNCAEAVE